MCKELQKFAAPVCADLALSPFGCAQGKLRRRGSQRFKWAGICGFEVVQPVSAWLVKAE
ncbi:MAG TPA: hypothetical protein VMW72_10810 [Sedimentisphaerales bacterium]|nr:hypothetical protein [Sedimentisphaerales bacterium]